VINYELFAPCTPVLDFTYIGGGICRFPIPHHQPPLHIILIPIVKETSNFDIFIYISNDKVTMYPSPPLAIAHTSNPVTSEHPGQPISNPKQKLSYQQSPDIGRAACASCRRRKIKCDKISPCTNCVRACISCDAAVRKRAPRRPRSTLAGSGELREKVLLRRLDCLEGMEVLRMNEECWADCEVQIWLRSLRVKQRWGKGRRC